MRLLNERGVALVTVMVMAAVLMVVGSLVAYKVMNSSRSSAVEGSKTKAYYAANGGIEYARLDLVDKYDETDLWYTHLQHASEPGKYPNTPQIEKNIDSIPVDIYIRDNNDGDGDLTKDNDLRVFVLSVAEAADGTKSMAEALVFYKLSDGAYESQLGDGAGKGGAASGQVDNVKNVQVTQ